MNDSEATEPIQDWEQERSESHNGEAESAGSAAEADAVESPVSGDFLPDDGAAGDAALSSSTPSSMKKDVKNEDSREAELASLIAVAESDAGESASVTGLERPSASSSSPGASSPTSESRRESVRTTAEQSGSYAYPDGSAASSQRLRPLPPDVKKNSWWIRHRRELTLIELVLTGLFFLLTLYFLFMWIFSKPAFACVPRPSWKAAAADGRWRTIVVHHTATERGSPESIDRYHREVRKWEGLGYHFLIGNGRSNGHDPTLGNGEVHVGVRWLEQRNGAHVQMRDVKNANSFSIGIALIGNFETSPPTPRQVAALRCLLRFLMDEYGIPKSAIHGHGQVSARHTDCPGKLFPLNEVLLSL